MRILYIGNDHSSSTSRHRADSLGRIGCDLHLLNPWRLVASRNRLLAWLEYRTGYGLIQSNLMPLIQAKLNRCEFKPDLIWVDGGELIGPHVLAGLSSRFRVPAVLFNVDDPTGCRDGRRFASLRSSIPLYDLCVSCRLETSLEMLAMGARRSIMVSRSYDEVFHSVQAIGVPSSLRQVISFVGTFIPGEHRDQFLLKLAQAGLSLSIAGNRWPRSRLFAKLKQFYQGPALSGIAYLQAISTPAISLGFLSHGNRDLVTQRSFETPACGGLLCAERTSEHQLLFEDGVEAVFWGSAEECIDVTRSLLADLHRNFAIRSAGRMHIMRAGLGNEDVSQQVLNYLRLFMPSLAQTPRL